MTSEPAKNFGKRQPVQPMHEEAPSRKRSNHVALLLMGTMASGGGAYALMPSEHCDPNRAAIAGQQQECQQRSSSSSSGGHGYSGAAAVPPDAATSPAPDRHPAADMTARHPAAAT